MNLSRQLSRHNVAINKGKLTQVAGVKTTQPNSHYPNEIIGCQQTTKEIEMSLTKRILRLYRNQIAFREI